MRVSHSIALTGLAATVAAVDIRIFHNERDCRGPIFSCPNIQPNTCCADGSALSIGFAAIPGDWNLDCRTYNGGDRCGGRESVQRSNGRNFVCVNLDSFDSMTGAGYGFAGKKARREGGAVEDGTGNGRCVRPSQLELEDGTQYRLDTLTDEQFTELVSPYKEADQEKRKVNWVSKLTEIVCTVRVFFPILSDSRGRNVPNTYVNPLPFPQ